MIHIQNIKCLVSKNIKPIINIYNYSIILNDDTIPMLSYDTHLNTFNKTLSLYDKLIQNNNINYYNWIEYNSVNMKTKNNLRMIINVNPYTYIDKLCPPGFKYIKIDFRKNIKEDIRYELLKILFNYYDIQLYNIVKDIKLLNTSDTMIIPVDNIHGYVYNKIVSRDNLYKYLIEFEKLILYKTKKYKIFIFKFNNNYKLVSIIYEYDYKRIENCYYIYNTKNISTKKWKELSKDWFFKPMTKIYQKQYKSLNDILS